MENPYCGNLWNLLLSFFSVEKKKVFHNGLCIVFLTVARTFPTFPQIPFPYYYNYLKLPIYLYILIILEKRLSNDPFYL